MNSSKELNTRTRTVSIPVLNTYQVETIERMINDPLPRLFPSVVPKSMTDRTDRLAVASALKDLAKLKALGLIEQIGESEQLELLRVTEKGDLLFNDEHKLTTSIQ